MRRRFAFVELDPRIPPVAGPARALAAEHRLPLDAARLLDELNKRLEDSDAAIGPSYLTKEEIYRRADGLDRVWQYDIMPLLGRPVLRPARPGRTLWPAGTPQGHLHGSAPARAVIPVELDELGPRAELRLTLEQGRALADSGVVTAVPSACRPGVWQVGSAGKVGAARIGDMEIRIKPKVDIARLLFLLGYAQYAAAWQPDTVLSPRGRRPSARHRAGAVAADRTIHPPGPAPRLPRR